MSIISKDNLPREIEAVDLGETLAAQYGVQRWATIVHANPGSTVAVVEATLDFPGSEPGLDTEIIDVDLDGFEMSDFNLTLDR